MDNRETVKQHETNHAQQWNWRGNLPLIIGSVSTFVIVMRLLSVAAFEPETAYGILQASGTATIIIGTIISLLGPFGMEAVAFLAYSVLSRRSTSDHSRTVQITLLMLASIVTLFTAPVLLFGVLLFDALLYASIRMYGPRVTNRVGMKVTDSRRANVIALRIVLSFLALGACYFVIITPPWLPAERIEVKKSPAVIGYVLGTTSGEVAILTMQPRRVIILDISDITERSLCSAGGTFGTATLSAILGQSAKYPRC